jgi:hypothetical protein
LLALRSPLFLVENFLKFSRGEEESTENSLLASKEQDFLDATKFFHFHHNKVPHVLLT